MSKRKTHEEFVNEMKIKQPDIKVLGRYVRSAIKIKVKCKKCKHKWSPIANNLSRNRKCPNCSLRYKTKSEKSFKKEMKIKHPDIKILGRYVNSRTKIEIICKKCWRKRLSSPISLYQSKIGCPSCAGRHRMTHSEFMHKIKEVSPSIKVLGQYINNKTKVKCKCKICKHKWSPIGHSLLRGSGCANCSGNLQYTTKSFKKKLKNINHNVKVLGGYITSKTKIKCKCKICKHKWSPISNSLLKGHGCPNCANHGFDLSEPAELYLYNIDDIYLGFGITNNFERRNKQHLDKSSKIGSKLILLHQFKFKKGQQALDIETKLKQKFPCMDTGIDGFRREAVSISYLDAVLLELEKIKDTMKL